MQAADYTSQFNLPASYIDRTLVAAYLGPADITGQLVSVQNSVMVPYSMLIWLKKSTAKRKCWLYFLFSKKAHAHNNNKPNSVTFQTVYELLENIFYSHKNKNLGTRITYVKKLAKVVCSPSHWLSWLSVLYSSTYCWQQSTHWDLLPQAASQPASSSHFPMLPRRVSAVHTDGSPPGCSSSAWRSWMSDCHCKETNLELNIQEMWQYQSATWCS